MLVWVLAYLGGLLTILSPCILPVLPFVFARAGEPFRKSGLPLLLGMAATFALFSTLAVLGGGEVVRLNEWGRYVAMGLLSLFAFTLIFQDLSEKITHPLAKLGGSLNRAGAGERTFGKSFVLGVATGLLWAPCAGPILGLILTGAALQGPGRSAPVLLLAYALGAATSLGAALFAGGKLLGSMKRYLGIDRWVRRILGVLVLFGVAAIALGWDRGILTKLSRVHTENFEQSLIEKLNPLGEPSAPPGSQLMPELTGAVEWIGSPPLMREALRGKVVLVDFWTYSCINCLRTIPYVKAWAEKYKDQGLIVIGVHSPEFAFERNPANVEKAVKELGITYPVAVDSDRVIWRAFHNRYWPAHYFIDAQGVIRQTHFGEGDYEESERAIQSLLAEAGHRALPSGTVQVRAGGAEAESLTDEVDSPETYIGYLRAKNFVSTPAGAPKAAPKDQLTQYALPRELKLNDWGLSGDWTLGPESATGEASSKIVFRFHARDLHLVLGPSLDGKPVRFRVRLGGRAPGADHGTDTNEAGEGVVREQRLYQLIRQHDPDAIEDQTFEIEFLDPGVQAFAFTFG